MSDTYSIQEPEPVFPVAFTPRQRFQDRVWLHWLLFAATICSTTLVGGFHYAGFASDFGRVPATPSLASLAFYLHGLWYSGTILAILGAHELGHYAACRYYQVDASRPFFIPMPPLPPLPSLTGTLGAFIRIREPIPTKRMLFDIGAAGPFAGFLVAVPALFIGTALSPVVALPHDTSDLMTLGDPLLVKLAAWLTWGSIPDGYSLNMHPMLFGTWFGLLATALNLFPIGQLDGGHITYAVFGRRSSSVTIVSIGATIGLAFLSTSWIVWTLLLIAMTIAMGPHHPRTIDEHIPLDRARLWLALGALVMLILCFTYNPIQLPDF
ncbi:MAG: site-2 protease family protein [Vicinamibacterales bacterium]|nr:site-2 protease family protein [Vicinamibacterales bacterium]